MKIETLPIPSPLKFLYSGPDISNGPLPAFFYFGGSGKDSLSQEPFNGPVPYLKDSPLRIISCDLPFHSSPPYDEAIALWAKEIKNGKDCISPCLDQIVSAIHLCLDKKIIDPKKLAVGGLSRGGWIATLLAAKEPLLTHILCFAPMIDPLFLEPFHGLEKNPIFSPLNLFSQMEKLFSRHIRFYIGNHDHRVSTKIAFDFLEDLTELAFEKKIRSAPIEMIMTPSIGLLGHGTPKSSFQEGALWLARQLLQEPLHERS
jgi:esterase FrsA